jgi:hypothetical protein
MKRKLLLLAGVLTLIAWTSTVDALGNCTCKFCFPGSTARCWSDSDIITCADFRLNYC